MLTREDLWTGFCNKVVAYPNTLVVDHQDVAGLCWDWAPEMVFPARPPRENGYVYLARAAFGVVKLGFSEKPLDRCRALTNSGQLHDLRVIVARCRRDEEKALHFFLRAERVRVERGPKEYFCGPKTEMLLSTLCRAAVAISEIEPNWDDSPALALSVPGNYPLSCGSCGERGHTKRSCPKSEAA
jgi:hypothetical protein